MPGALLLFCLHVLLVIQGSVASHAALVGSPDLSVHTEPELSEEEPEVWFECQDTEECWEDCLSWEEQDRIEDGGGVFSTADWSSDDAGTDCFADLRKCWYRRIQEWDLTSRLKQGCTKGGPGLLSDSDIKTIRGDAVQFLAQKGIEVTDTIEPGQPFALEIIAGLLRLCGDKDQALPQLLSKGISTGIWEEIAPSGVFEPEDRVKRLEPEWTDIRSCFENWASAESNEDQVEALLENEVQQGWVEKWAGSWADAVERWGERAVCGKLALVQVDGRDDRLIGDSSAPGASPNARFPERVRNPKVVDVEKGIASCREKELEDGEGWCAVTIDVSAAHKRLKMQEKDAGAAFFSCKGRLYRYLVAHFGAAWSAWWWARTAAMLVRLIHRFLGCAHITFVYVDDFLILLRKKQAWETACLLAVLLTCLGVPLSWHKLAVGQQVSYLGLLVDMTSYTLGLGADKVARLRTFLAGVVKGSRLDKRAFRKSLGALQWASGIAPSLRPWLAAFYRNLNVPRLAWVSGCPESIRAALDKVQRNGCLSEDIPGSGAKAGMLLKFVGRSSISDPELWKGWCPKRKSSLGFVSWDNRRVKVSRDSDSVARLWEDCISLGAWIRPCRLLRWVGGDCAADAWAAGDWASVGGWWMREGPLVPEQCFWFTLELHRSSLPKCVSLGADMGSDIAFFEALAQVILLVLMGSADDKLRGGNVLMKCDNEGVVGAAAKGLSTTQPLCAAIQCLAAWEQRLDIKTVIQHIPGEENILADALSRWRKKRRLLEGLQLENQHVVDLSVVLGPLLTPHPCVRS